MVQKIHTLYMHGTDGISASQSLLEKNTLIHIKTACVTASTCNITNIYGNIYEIIINVKQDKIYVAHVKFISCKFRERFSKNSTAYAIMYRKCEGKTV